VREYTKRVFSEHNPDQAPDYFGPEMKWHGGLLGTVEGAENVAANRNACSILFPKANEAALPCRALERLDGPSMRVARPKPGYKV
jgi:hypothetical protein